MNESPSYLAERAAERRWRVITGVVAVLALGASALWILARHAELPSAPTGIAAPAAAPAVAARPQRTAL